MMHEFCVGQGWCGGIVAGKRSHVTNFIPKSGQVTAKLFVRWLLLAEGIKEQEILLRPDIKKLERIFIKHMGPDPVDAELLR